MWRFRPHKIKMPSPTQSCIHEGVPLDKLDAMSDDEGFCETKVEEVKTAKCYNCGKPGHFQDRCPEPKRQTPIERLASAVEEVHKCGVEIRDCVYKSN